MLSLHDSSIRSPASLSTAAAIAGLAGAWLAASPAATPIEANAAVSGGTTIEITHVANEGFLISGAGRKVLIDAIFTEGFGRFDTPPPEVLNQEQDALPPFDHIDAVLVTHGHPDHLNPAMAVQHLAHDPKAILIGPPQVNDLLKTIETYPAVATRIIAVSPEPGRATESSAGDLRIESVALQHLSDPERKHQNLGFIFSVGGLKVFHVGDAGVAAPADYQNLKLADENIDLALLNCYWLDDENVGAAREAIAYIRPKAIVLMHQTAGQVGHYRDLIGKLPDLPPVYMAAAPMETLRFRLADGKLSADALPLQSQANRTSRPQR